MDDQPNPKPDTPIYLCSGQERSPTRNVVGLAGTNRFKTSGKSSISAVLLVSRANNFRATGLRVVVQKAFLRSGIGGDYKVSELVLTFVTLSSSPPAVQLKRFTPAALHALFGINTSLALGALDFDWTVLSTGDEVENAIMTPRAEHENGARQSPTLPRSAERD